MTPSPKRIAKRQKAVEAYAKNGTYKGAAKESGFGRKFIKLWVERCKAGQGLSDRPRRGRPGVGLDKPEAIQLIKDCVSKDKAGPSVIERRLRERLRIEASYETVRRFTKANIARPVTPKRKPLLTVGHKTARLAFAKAWRRKSWDRVCVSDSKYFWLNEKGRSQKTWVLYGLKPPTVAAGDRVHKVHAYAAVSRWGRTSLFFTVGTTGLKAASKGVNAQVYLDLLQNQMIPAIRELMDKCPTTATNGSSRWVFQQDNARAHTARLVQDWLLQQDFDLMKWPAKSPDLSWIENLWAYVAQKLRNRPGLSPSNFQQALREEWDAIPEHVCMNMFKSIPRRLQECIDNEGGSTSY